MSDWRQSIDAYVDSHAERWRDVRRHLHAHPEPSREEFETTRFLAEQIEEAGVPARISPSGRGLIAEPPRAGEPRRVALRADLDALCIQDAKEVAYRSSRAGVVHACGHDAHAAMALGAVATLWHVRAELPPHAVWRAIFQPAEETGEGALEMIEAGAVQNVRAIVALHVDPDLEVGRLAYRTGVLTANCRELHVVIRGRGGHAARPHLSVDPIAVAVSFMGNVYQFVPRSVDSRDPAVITFGCIQGGTSANVIPERVELKGTIRTLSPGAGRRVEEQVRQIASGLAGASHAHIDVAFREVTEAVINDPVVTTACLAAAREVVGAENVEEIALPSMGGEDFSAYLRHAPGCLLRLGVAAPDRPRNFLHSPLFDLDERALALGIKVLARSVILLSNSAESERS
jgi:amidohydrolase